MIATVRSDAAPLDLTDHNVVNAGHNAGRNAAVAGPPARPVSAAAIVAGLEDELDALAVENDTLKGNLRRLLEIVDQQAADRASLADLGQRLRRAEETIEDLVAIIVSSRPYVPVS